MTFPEMIRALIGFSLSAFLLSSFQTEARAAAPFQRVQSPSYYRIQLGDYEVTALYDGGGEIDASLLQGDPKQIEGLLRKDFTDGKHLKGTVAAFLVNTGKKLVLVDAGTGGHWGGPSLGKVARNMRLAGYRPDQVDLVLVTHLHADHVGGIVSAQGKRVYTNAEVRMAKAESDFWLSEDMAKQAPKDAQEFFKISRDSAAPYIAAKKWRPFEGTDALVEGIRPYPILGHTPGHTGYEVTSKGETLLIWGDVVHAMPVQLPHPEISIVYDADSPSAVKSRQLLFESLASKGILAGGAHMPFPSLGRLRKETTGYTWVPVVYTDKP
jgi:glyoxylase-like metal-dependent hydrolase (beta-lactamase superfamily II)